MDSLVVSLCLLCVVSLAHAFPPMPFFRVSKRSVGTGTNGDSESLAQCEANKPCGVVARKSFHSGLHQDYPSEQICACPGTCPLSWDSVPDRTISMRLSSNRGQLWMQIKYCHSVVPETLCEPNQVALHVKGGSFIPTQVVAYHCSCPSNMALRTSNAWKQDYQLHREYVCVADRH